MCRARVSGRRKFFLNLFLRLGAKEATLVSHPRSSYWIAPYPSVDFFPICIYSDPLPRCFLPALHFQISSPPPLQSPPGKCRGIGPAGTHAFPDARRAGLTSGPVCWLRRQPDTELRVFDFSGKGDVERQPTTRLPPHPLQQQREPQDSGSSAGSGSPHWIWGSLSLLGGYYYRCYFIFIF